MMLVSMRKFKIRRPPKVAIALEIDAFKGSCGKQGLQTAGAAGGEAVAQQGAHFAALTRIVECFHDAADERRVIFAEVHFHAHDPVAFEAAAVS